MYGETADTVRRQYPLQKGAVERLYKSITGTDLGDDVGIGEARYRLLEAAGENPDPFECGSPFTKEELEAIWDQVNDN